MAAEIQFSLGLVGATTYALIFPANSGTMVWRGQSSGFEDYATGSYSGYPVSCTELGTNGQFYYGNFPPSVPPGVYGVLAKRQVGSDPAETDPNVANGSVEWNGRLVAALADLATSGQLSQFLPVRLSKANMVLNYSIYLKSAADHVSPFTSGLVSGQILRDGGAWGPLESGAFTEMGNGFYNLQALTSGDLNASVVSLLFTGVAVSGGVSDPLPQSFILQRSSGG